MVRATKWARTNLFLSSYLPLWLILLVIHLVRETEIYDIQILTDPISYFLSNMTSIVIIGVLAAIIIIPIRHVQKCVAELLSEENVETITVQGKEDMTSEYLLYVITYVFPFMTTTTLDVLGGIALIGALFTIGFLYIRANLFHVNPTLLLLYNYRLYKITDDRGNSRYVFSKKESILRNDPIALHSLHGVIYIES